MSLPFISIYSNRWRAKGNSERVNVGPVDGYEKKEWKTLDQTTGLVVVNELLHTFGMHQQPRCRNS